MKELLKKVCVRTCIKESENTKVNQGSGIIVRYDKCYFVITTYHCIYGENDEYLHIDTKKKCIK